MSRDAGQVPVQEWIDACNAALEHDAVRAALKGKNVTIQMVISDSPRGEIRYRHTGH